MPLAQLAAAHETYPERDPAREPALDRVLANLGFWWQRAFARRLGDSQEFSGRVLAHARRFAAELPGEHLAQVRYRIRRDGLGAERLAECLGLCGAALGELPAPDTLGAAMLLVKSRIAELSSPEERTRALVLAALAFAVQGIPVHVVTSSDTRARRLAEALQGPLAALGGTAACVAQSMNPRARRAAYRADVVCGAQRVLAMDYLRDRLLLGRRRGALKSRLERLASGARTGAQTLLHGLHCALVDEADCVMLDDARAPLVISADADQARQRLVFEQALEIARVLAPGADFATGDEGAVLTQSGAERLAQLVLPLGGDWLARPRREELVAAALDALHVLERDRDYRVVQGRVLFPEPEGEPPGAEEQDPLLRSMLEVKEGCKLSGARDVLTRLSVARFFGRYLHLGGMCADARGLETEFWTLYSLKTQRCGEAQIRGAPCAARVFVTTEARREALADALRDRAAREGRVLLALRTQEEAQALAPALSELVAQERLRVNLHPAQRDAEGAPAGEAHLVVGELHEAARHVVQIKGAYGARSCEQYLALEDPGVAAAVGGLAAALGRTAALVEGELPEGLAQWMARRAQRGAERMQAALRRAAMQRERQLEDLLAFSGQLD